MRGQRPVTASIRARIDAVTIGRAYGCRGRARVAGGIIVYSTPTMPFGFDDEARRRAARWAADNGYDVDPDYLAPPIDLIARPVELPVAVELPGKIEIKGVPWPRR